jgi:hypothetical protein
VPGGDEKTKKKPSAVDKRKADRLEQVAVELELRRQLVDAFKSLAAASMPPPAPVEFTEKFKTVEEFLKICKIEGADAALILSKWPAIEDAAVLDASDLKSAGVPDMASKKFLYFRRRYK